MDTYIQTTPHSIPLFSQIDYYKSYMGPPIKFAYIQSMDDHKEDVTEIIQKLYGENLDWNGNLYTVAAINIPNSIGNKLYIEFDDYNPNFPNSITFSSLEIKKETDPMNPPLYMPMSKK